MLIENPDLKADQWTQPNDLTIDEAVKLVRSIKKGKSLAVAMYDGSVRRLEHLDPEKFSDEKIRSLFCANDGLPFESGMLSGK